VEGSVGELLMQMEMPYISAFFQTMETFFTQCRNTDLVYLGADVSTLMTTVVKSIGVEEQKNRLDIVP
jgi:hypothetical protein